jgi:hypothetical protein
MLYGCRTCARDCNEAPRSLGGEGVFRMMTTKVGLCDGLWLGLLWARGAVLAHQNTYWNIRSIPVIPWHDHRVA